MDKFIVNKKTLSTFIILLGLSNASHAVDYSDYNADPLDNLQVSLPEHPLEYASFYDWKIDFIRRHAKNSNNQGQLQRLLANAKLNQGVLNADKKQAEFVKMPWSYVDSAVSGNRVTTGRKNLNNNKEIFRKISQRYAVHPSYVAAIWGMESSFGGFTGNADLVSSLSTLAFDGRRRDFAENELLALLTLLNRGDVRWGKAKGSWAGGMGHTQFIPATWLKYGVDADNNGRSNPWNKADALTSTANYLTQSGWVKGIDPVYEVRLPKNFNFKYHQKSLTMADWDKQGIRLISGGFIPNQTPLKLWLPAGKNGPALLTSKNFEVIKVYNNSSSYALGVSLLGNRLAGKQGLQTAWPRHEKPLATYQVQQLQQVLTNKGYDTKGIDGIIGANTKIAFAQWQNANGHIPDGFICQRSVKGLL